MLARLMAFLVWGLLAFSAAYWLVHLLAKPLATPSQAQPAAEQRSGQADLTRLFGAATLAATAAAPPVESRFKLLGVVAPNMAGTGKPRSAVGEGVALIAVDGVARTVRVGALVDTDLQLLAVEARSVSLGRGDVVSLSLQIEAPVIAATGALLPAPLSQTVLGGNPPIGLPAAPQAPVQMPPPVNR
jgi:general secretion pathway protein C